MSIIYEYIDKVVLFSAQTTNKKYLSLLVIHSYQATKAEMIVFVVSSYFIARS